MHTLYETQHRTNESERTMLISVHGSHSHHKPAAALSCHRATSNNHAGRALTQRNSLAAYVVLTQHNSLAAQALPICLVKSYCALYAGDEWSIVLIVAPVEKSAQYAWHLTIFSSHGVFLRCSVGEPATDLNKGCTNSREGNERMYLES